jgi:beta-phosphoglucomutase-like phosphatase (HAD superfamily)
LAGSFDAEATGDDVKRGKPEPDLFLLAAERIGIHPARCVVFEDASQGVAAAAAAGMRSICIPNAKSQVLQFPVEPTVTFSDLTAAIPWLESQGVVAQAQNPSAEPTSLQAAEG